MLPVERTSLLQRRQGAKGETNMLKAVMTTTLAIGSAASALADHHEPQGGGVLLCKLTTAR